MTAKPAAVKCLQQAEVRRSRRCHPVPGAARNSRPATPRHCQQPNRHRGIGEIRPDFVDRTTAADPPNGTRARSRRRETARTRAGSRACARRATQHPATEPAATETGPASPGRFACRPRVVRSCRSRLRVEHAASTARRIRTSLERVAAVRPSGFSRSRMSIEFVDRRADVVAGWSRRCRARCPPGSTPAGSCREVRGPRAKSVFAWLVADQVHQRAGRELRQVAQIGDQRSCASGVMMCTRAPRP